VRRRQETVKNKKNLFGEQKKKNGHELYVKQNESKLLMRGNQPTNGVRKGGEKKGGGGVADEDGGNEK